MPGGGGHLSGTCTGLSRLSGMHITRIGWTTLTLTALALVAGCQGDPERQAPAAETGTPTVSSTSADGPTETSPTTSPETSAAPDSSSAATNADAGAEESPPGTRCPSVVITAAEIPADVYIRAGNVDCANATQAMQDYFTALSEGKGPGAGRGPLTIREWHCGTGPATDPWAGCVTDNGKEIEAVPWEE